ncbi:MAG: ABC transporter ATP-binding protein [Deltaproteobacteria bacterium]|nr:ABC transporter ATP-binding protein [Deltaproteobacteria bacterium]
MGLLEIKNLRTCFSTDKGEVPAVDGVSLSVNKGEVVSIVGGSGSGKTVLGLSILRLVSEQGRIADGEIIFKGVDLLKLPLVEMRRIRGRKISMIFQEPMTSLNPVFTIGEQIEEAIRIHNPKISKHEAEENACEILNLVGIADPVRRYSSYPHEFSGGMRQRVMIAMALSCRPDLLIADEPTTALDVTIQSEILKLLESLQAKFGMSIILITHDFGIVAQIADRVYVMHNGKVVEDGDVRQIFGAPKDDYTKKLLAAVPVL